MRNVMMVLALAAVLVLPACGGLKGLQEGYVDAEAIQPSVNAVVERHNGIIDGSIDLSMYTDEQRAGFVLEADVLKAIVDKAMPGTEAEGDK